MKNAIKLISLMLAVVMMFSCFVFASDDIKTLAKTAMNETIASLASNYKKTSPQFGDEWAVMALGLSGTTGIDSVFAKYYESAKTYVETRIPQVNFEGAVNAIDRNRSTENARLILALSSIGKYATVVGQYDITQAFNNFTWISRMGLMGPIYTLIALDTYGYELSDSTIRQQCVDYIVDAQLSSGGWDLAKKNADVDVTAMALQALYNYKAQNKVKAAADKALAWLSTAQFDDGGYSSYGFENSGSAAQVLIALCTWGIDPLTDSRFIKNGNSVLSNMLSYRVKDSSLGWGFTHTVEDSTNGSEKYKGGAYVGMSTQQCAYALLAYDRFVNGKTNLYNMSEKNPFTDVKGNAHQTDIEYCLNAGLMNGIGNQKFNPNGNFNRAMLITTLYRLAGSPKVSGSASFSDAVKGSWYSDALKWAEDKGIAGGYGNGKFGPDDIITPEQIWTFLYRFSKLMGYDTASSASINSFSDYQKLSSWATDAAKWAAAKNIIKISDGKLNPTSNSTRALSATYLARFDQNLK